MSFLPKLSILPHPQRLLWAELGCLSPEWTLYGGTAVALYLGHRNSIDFDFFCLNDIDTVLIYGSVPFLDGAKITQQAKNTLTCLVDRGGPVKVSFFGLPRIRMIGPVCTATDNGLCVASLVDLAGTKVSVVQQRAEAKDYIDLDALIQAGVGLPLALSAARFIYGSHFNPQTTLKALSYFDDGDLNTLPEDVKTRLVKAVTLTDLEQLPPFDNLEPIQTR